MTLNARFQRTKLLAAISTRRGSKRTQRLAEKAFEKALVAEYQERFLVAIGHSWLLYMFIHAPRPAPAQVKVFKPEFRRSYRFEAWTDNLQNRLVNHYH